MDASPPQLPHPSPLSLDGLKERLHDRGSLWDLVIVVAMLCSMIALFWALPMQEFAAGLQHWSQQLGLLSGVIYVGAFTLLTVLALPVWPMPFVAGAVFGTWKGTLLASLGCVCGAAVSFLLARLLGRTAFRKYLEASPRMRALEHTVEAAHWKIVAAVRLSHFMPFGVQNYAFGLTRLHFGVFLLTTWLVALPGTALQVYLGDLGHTSMDAWQEQGATDWQTWGLRISGLAVMACAAGYIGWLGRSTYRQAVEKQLEKAVKEEMARSEEVTWPWWRLSLTGLAALLLAAAVWCVVERDALRESIQQMLPASRRFASSARETD